MRTICESSFDFCGKIIRPSYAYIDGQFRQKVAITVNKDGIIENVYEADCILAGADSGVMDLPGIVLIPGFINGHSHAFHRALRGRSGIGASGVQNFWLWRDEMYKLVENADYKTILEFCTKTFFEMLSAGITTVGEFHYVHHGNGGFDLDDAVLAAASVTGIRLVLLVTLYERAGFQSAHVNPNQRRFACNFDDFSKHVLALLERNLPPNITIGVAAHSLRAVPKTEVKKLYDFAKAHSLPFHIHLEEQPQEVADCEAVECCQPSELLLSTLGADANLTNVTAVHCTFTKRKNLNALGAAGVTVCVCPTTEGFLGDGIPHLEASDRLALGTDCNNRLCFLEEMRWLTFCQNLKTNTRNAVGLDSQKLLQIATVNGAHSLGLTGKCGAFTPGSFCDFIAFDLSSHRLADLSLDTLESEVGDALVFSAGNSEIAMTVVGGRRVFLR